MNLATPLFIPTAPRRRWTMGRQSLKFQTPRNLLNPLQPRLTIQLRNKSRPRFQNLSIAIPRPIFPCQTWPHSCCHHRRRPKWNCASPLFLLQPRRLRRTRNRQYQPRPNRKLIRALPRRRLTANERFQSQRGNRKTRPPPGQRRLTTSPGARPRHKNRLKLPLRQNLRRCQRNQRQSRPQQRQPYPRRIRLKHRLEWRRPRRLLPRRPLMAQRVL